MTARLPLNLLLIVALGGTLAACGRKAPLDTPYQAAVEAQKEAKKNGETAPEPEKPEAEKPFFLDGLL